MASELFTGVDAAWLHMDRPENTADVVSVMTLADRMTLEELRGLVERRLLAFQRFRQRVVHRGPLGTGAAWEDDPDFAVERHVVHHTIGAGREALQAFASAVATEPLDPARPLWRIHLVDAEGRGSALVAKFHHCIADGFALVAVLLSMADDPPPAPQHPHTPGARRALPTFDDPVATLKAALQDPAQALGLAAFGGAFATTLARLSALWPDPGTPLKHRLSGRRRVAWSRPLPLAAIRAAGRATGATINDLLIAALAGALRGWPGVGRVRHGAGDLRAIVPVNLRPLGTAAALGNAFGLVFLDLPLRAPTAAARVRELRTRMDAIKHRPDAAVTFGVLSALGRLPIAAEQLVNRFFTSKASLVVTNVPGPRQRLHVVGHRIDDMMFWVPHPSGLGLGVSILSYAGSVRVGVRVDSAVTGDPADLVSRFEAEVDAICAAATPHPLPAEEPEPAEPDPALAIAAAPAPAGPAELHAPAAPRP